MTAGILDPGPQIAAAELTPQEQALADRIDKAPNSNIAEIALALGGAFLLYRLYMKRRLTEAMKDQDPSNLALVAGSIYTSFVPEMVRLFAPHIVQGYLIGVSEARQGSLDQEFLQDIAESYVLDLGGHLNEVSLESALQGYTRQVNRRVPARRAVQNVISAYGVPNRTMNSLVGVWSQEDTKVLSSMPTKSARDAKAAAIIDKALAQRGSQIGDTEAWAARGQAKQLVWMYSMQKGLIPEESTKIWKTAKDERVCPVCGPMHKVEVPLDEPFTTDAGKVWSPPMHPSCRCDVDLAFDILGEFKPVREDALIGKAYRDDPFDRDRRGRFARVETRTKPVAVPGINLTPINLEIEEEPKKAPLTRAALGRGTLTRASLGERQPLVEGGKPLAQERSLRREGMRRSLQRTKLTRSQLSAMRPEKRLVEGWDHLGEPMYTIVGKGTQLSHAQLHGDELVTTSKQPFHKYSEVDSALENYWAVWKDGMLMDFKTGNLGTGVQSYKDEDGAIWEITEKDFETLLDWLIMDMEDQGYQIQVHGPGHDYGRSRYINAADLADSMDLWEDIQKATPQVLEVNYFKPDVGTATRIPGEWLVVDPAQTETVGQRRSDKNRYGWAFDETTWMHEFNWAEPKDMFD